MDQQNSERNFRKTRVGRVVSSKMDKTVVVVVDRKVNHPLYGKAMHKSKKYKAHDETNSVTEGSLVRIMETKPLSKEKRWRVTEVLETVEE